MFQALARMMDVPTALAMLAGYVRGVGRGGALLIFACGLIALFPLGYLWYRFDLASTWHWFDWLAAGAPADLQTARTTLEASPETAAAAPDDETLKAMIFILPFCFTLLPSAVQLGLARFVTVPGLGQLVKASIAFDLVTDWPTMWQLAVANPWFASTFKWGPVIALAQAIGTALGTVVVSLIVQTAFILVAAVLFYMGLILVFGDAPARPTPVLVTPPPAGGRH